MGKVTDTYIYDTVTLTHLTVFQTQEFRFKPYTLKMVEIVPSNRQQKIVLIGYIHYFIHILT